MHTTVRQFLNRELGVPVYVLPDASIPPEIRASENQCAGYTSTLLDVQTRAFNPDYAGRGFCCVVSDALADVDVYSDELEKVIPSERTQIVMHEAGHYLGTAKRPNATADAESLPVEKLAPRALQPINQTFEYESHDLDFVRACCHLSYRAHFAGLMCSTAMLLTSERYGLSDTFKYDVAFADEVKERVAEPIADILQSPAPGAAVSLYESDCANRTQGSKHDCREAVDVHSARDVLDSEFVPGRDVLGIVERLSSAGLGTLAEPPGAVSYRSGMPMFESKAIRTWLSTWTGCVSCS